MLWYVVTLNIPKIQPKGMRDQILISSRDGVVLRNGYSIVKRIKT